jgi:hypothetical protein
MNCREVERLKLNGGKAKKKETTNEFKALMGA